MTKVAIIESKMSRTSWADRFDGAFEFDRYALCSDSSKKKILKATSKESMYPYISFKHFFKYKLKKFFK